MNPLGQGQLAQSVHQERFRRRETPPAVLAINLAQHATKLRPHAFPATLTMNPLDQDQLAQFVLMEHFLQ